MASTGKASGPSAAPRLRGSEQSQIDFELEFFQGVLDRFPDYVEVLRIVGNNLTLKGRVREGLEIDRRLVRLRPHDPLAHYNLACSYCLARRYDQAIATLRRAVELGYRDFRFLRQDKDLDPIRDDPRYLQILREYENR